MDETWSIFCGPYQVSGPSFVPEGKRRSMRDFVALTSLWNCDAELLKIAMQTYGTTHFSFSVTDSGSMIITRPLFTRGRVDIIKKETTIGWKIISISQIVESIKICNDERCNGCYSTSYISSLGLGKYNNCTRIVVNFPLACREAQKVLGTNSNISIYIPLSWK